MKARLLIITLVAILLLPASVSAQSDKRAPGIYAIAGEESLPLPYTRSTIVGSGDFVSYAQVYYKGETSGLNIAGNTFVLVIDTNKTAFTVKYPFVKKLTPDNMKLLPLSSNAKKKRREYEAGIKVAGGLLYEEEYGIPFKWEKISNNSFLITIPTYLVSGEYGFSFCLHRLSTYDYFYSIFGFTIPAGQ